MVFLKARQLPAAGERIYPHDGNPEISNLTNRQGFSLTAYCWRVQQPRAAALFIHGVQSHARFEFLRHLQPDEADIEAPPSAGASSASSCKQYTRWCIYKGSWIEQLNVAGCSVYAGDMQSFGLSAGWKGRRCSVERLDHLASDVICFAEFAASDLAKQAQTENASPSPLFLVGISMGGFAVIRALELMGQENHWLLPRPLPSSPPFPSPPAAAPAAADAAAADAAAAGNSSSKEGEKKKPQLAGCVALCPMLSVEKASAGFSNKAAAKVGCVLSRLAPHLRVVKLPAARLAWIDQQKNEDPLVTAPMRLPCRMGVEVLSAIPRVHTEAKYIPSNFRLLIIHAEQDTLVEPAGSKRFHSESGLHILNRQLKLLPGDRGHYLVIEPENADVIAAIKDWMAL